MNNFSLSSLTIQFTTPWLLLLIIPLVALMLWPYFRLPKQVRKTRNRVISLVLHSVILVTLVLMVSGMTLHSTETVVKNDVILLVDMSDSNRSSQEDMNKFIRSVLDEREDNYRVGIITFANGNVYAAQMRTDSDGVYKDYLQNDTLPLGNATNIADALLYAKSALSNPANGRIILLSDGIQTDGNALAVVKNIADGGTRVDTVFFTFEGRSSEVLISNVNLPQTASVGDMLQITVTTRSGSATAATLQLYDNGELFDTMDVDLSGGEDTFVFEYPLTTPNLHEFSVEISAQGDTLKENNTYYSYINIQTHTNVLVVDGSGSGAGAIVDILDDSYDVTTIVPEDLPMTITELSGYQEVIFVNVANADLPRGFDNVLTEYVQVYGGGFFTIGGDRAYQQNDMQGSKYEALLPVEASTENKTLGLLLVIDCSGSMNEKASGTNTPRIDLAKAAAIASVEALGPDDYVGIIGFNSSATGGTMRSMAQKDTIINQIRSLTTATGTRYSSAINSVRSVMSTFNQTDLRHIIFLADGNANDSTSEMNTVKSNLRQMANQGITISTIALGPDVSTANLQEFAQIGGGKFYNVARETELVQIMVKETTRVAGEYYTDKTFTPVVDTRTSAIAGIGEFPTLDGYYGTKLKDGATMVLVYDSNPIYAEWTVGNGRVGSFMSDIKGMSSQFLADIGTRFVANVVGSLFPKVTNNAYDSVRAEFAQDNFTTRISVTTDSATAAVSAEIIAPDGARQVVSLEKLSDRAFAGIFNTDQKGVYTVLINNGSEVVTTYTTFSYSAEYYAFYDESEAFDFMEDLSKNGNGTVLFSAENLFGKDNEVFESDIDLQLPFILVCASLFLLDIFVRKFKIKWPREIVDERRNKKQGIV